MKNSTKTPILYIEAKKISQEFDTKPLDKLPKDKPILITYSIQYKQLANKIKQYLTSKGYNIIGVRQVLGCSKLKTNASILLISDGKFHALNLAIQNKTPLYIYNTKTIDHIDIKQIEKLQRQKQSALSKFLMEEKVGILVSTKIGQNRIKDAKALKIKLEKHGKKPYLFVSETLNLSELENFPIKIWINTACPGLIYDSPRILNIDDLSSIKY